MKRPTRNTLDPSRLPPLLTPAQYATIAQMHVATVRAQLRTGQLKGCKVGPHLWRIPREEATKLLAE